MKKALSKSDMFKIKQAEKTLRMTDEEVESDVNGGIGLTKKEAREILKSFGKIILVAVMFLAFSTNGNAGNVQRSRWEGIAIGVGAAVLGSIVLNEVKKKHKEAEKQVKKRVWNPGHYISGRWVEGRWIFITEK